MKLKDNEIYNMMMLMLEITKNKLNIQVQGFYCELSISTGIQGISIKDSVMLLDSLPTSNLIDHVIIL